MDGPFTQTLPIRAAARFYAQPDRQEVGRLTQQIHSIYTLQDNVERKFSINPQVGQCLSMLSDCFGKTVD